MIRLNNLTPIIIPAIAPKTTPAIGRAELTCSIIPVCTPVNIEDTSTVLSKKNHPFIRFIIFCIIKPKIPKVKIDTIGITNENCKTEIKSISVVNISYHHLVIFSKNILNAKLTTNKIDKSQKPSTLFLL